MVRAERQSRQPRLDRHELGGGAYAAFTDRFGGVSAPPYDELNLGGTVGDLPESVARNRRLAVAAIGVATDRVVWMRQVHGADVVAVDGQRSGTPEADGVVTDRSGLALGVLVADCTPVLLADPVRRVVAAVHAGRPGLARGVVPAAIARMTELGARPERCVAVVGPAVCAGCYEVPAALRTEVVAASVPEAWAETRRGTPAVDVAGGVVAQLRAAGVGDVRRVSICTMESPAHYSYRRDGLTGRFAGYIWLTADDGGAPDGSAAVEGSPVAGAGPHG